MSKKNTAAKTAAAKKSVPVKRTQNVGVIASIMEVLSAAKKTRKAVTAKQILAQLEKRFPQRSSGGMFVTVRAQLSRLGTEAAGSETARSFQVSKQQGEGREMLYSAK